MNENKNEKKKQLHKIINENRPTETVREKKYMPNYADKSIDCLSKIH